MWRMQLFVDPSRMDELRQALDKNGVVRGAEVEVYRRDRTKKVGTGESASGARRRRQYLRS